MSGNVEAGENKVRPNLQFLLHAFNMTDQRLDQKSQYESVYIPLELVRDQMKSRHPDACFSAESSYATDTIFNEPSFQAQMNRDSIGTCFWFPNKNGSFVKIQPVFDELNGDHTQYASKLAEKTNNDSINVSLTEDNAKAVFLFAGVLDGQWVQGGEYGFLRAVFIDLFPGLRSLGDPDAAFVPTKDGDLKVVYHDDAGVLISNIGAFQFSGGEVNNPLALYYHAKYSVRQEGGESFCSLVGVQIFADKKTGLKHKIDALVLKDCNDLPTMRNVIHGKKRQATNPLDQIFGGFFGAIFGFLFAPVIYLSMAIEHFDGHLSGINLFILLLKLIGSVTLAPFYGFYYGLFSCPDTGTLSAFSPKAHFKNWLAYKLYACQDPDAQTQDEARQDLLNTHGRHNFVYTLLALTLLLSLSGFAIVFSGVLPLPFFVSTALGLMLIPIAPWSLGLAVILPVLVVGGIAILAYLRYQAHSDRQATAKANQSLEPGRESTSVAAGQLSDNPQNPPLSPASSQDGDFHTAATTPDSPFVSPASSPHGSGSDTES